MQTLLCLLLVTLLGFTAKPLWADAVEISTNMHGLAIGPSLRFIEDAERTMTSEDVFALDPRAWKSSPQQNPNFGFTRSAYWARFQMKNPYSTTQRIVLEYGYANADYIDFHMPNEKGEYSWRRSGDQMPITVREISYRLPVFVVDVPPGIHNYYMRIETEGVVQFPLRVWTPEAFHGKRASESAFLGTGRGLAFGMIREIGVIKGFISSDMTRGADALAQLIFESGFSTSAGVNEISGRGVGMDAVKRMLEKEGATVNIELNKSHAQAGSQFIPFSLHITLPAGLYRRVESEQNLAMVS